MPLRVAVIGAGAAGLAALRHLSRKPTFFQPVAFEQSFSVGGTWVFTEQTGTDEYGLPIHASMYRNLRTNLPNQVMSFPDFPFPADLPSFVKHTDVRKYLEDYAKHFNLEKYIQLGTCVERVHPEKTKDETVWEVTTRKVGEATATQWLFDMVIVCNGHYSVPLIPQLEGMESFKGTVMHSHSYREPEQFVGKKVACLGAGSSGQDISLDMASFAEKVYICHRKPRLQSVLPDNVEQRPGIRALTENGFTAEDGTFTEIDVLMLCTGYKYNFPFLTETCAVNTEDERVTPLYKHAIHIEWPTLSFIGVPKVICPFPLFDCQVQFVLASQDGTMSLPQKEDMYLDTQRDFGSRLSSGLPARHAHHMGQLQWGYNDELAHLAHFPPIPAVVRTLYDHVHEHRVTNLTGYKKRNFVLTGTTSFKELST